MCVWVRVGFLGLGMDIWIDVRVRIGRILGIVEFWQSVLVWDSKRS